MTLSRDERWKNGRKGGGNVTQQRQDMVTCQICGQQKKKSGVMPVQLIRKPLADRIRETHPDLNPGGFICMADLNRFRSEYVQSVIEDDKGELSALEHEVVRSLEEQELLSKNINAVYDRQLTVGEHLADKIADFGGSWKFIGIFAVVLVSWMLINSVALFWKKPFDPYPYIFLNLVLSCLAAIQAPIIMMSQNRQEARDRLQAEQDYRINLKAELEIRNLHEKMDHLLANQWERLLEIQAIQTELMEELAERRKKG
jgi:uncharacterized membrane protein